MNLFAEAAHLSEANIPFAMATIVETKGHAPRHSARMLIHKDGSLLGTIGGGVAERYVVDQALEAINQRAPRTVYCGLTHNGKQALGSDCAGGISVHIEVHGLKPELLLVGGGHVNNAVAHLAAGLGFSIIVTDSYLPSLDPMKFPHEAKLIHGETMVEALAKTTITANTHALVATNHEDTEGLTSVIDSEASFIGLLGSRAKVRTLIERMRNRGIDDAILANLHAPLGLDIGGETPKEIAISIMAELMMEQNGRSGQPMNKLQDRYNQKLVAIRGAGDIATGVAIRLHNAGYRIVMMEMAKPTVIRTSVSFAQAQFDGEATVEGIAAEKAEDGKHAIAIMDAGNIAVITDADGHYLKQLKPRFLIDAILAKQNLGTRMTMAPTTIGLGPGFTAQQDVHAVIETNRGHRLGRVIVQGSAAENTGIPGNIAGFTSERVLRAPCAGIFTSNKKLGDLVKKGEEIARINNQPLTASIDGMLRGLLNNGLEVSEGFKVGDIDPRGEKADYLTASDKARAIGGGVLEAMLQLSN
ncbi:selenium-dependent molybdenum cofactor biosynthesis protein YqeB [Pelagibaculum spongiae]|uniref:EF2563 family selenium-dependent molybdenum hydroxylase system protein n=1 Tax=Pelagibaculum spongiae TaxID=2080658 RepID=A0A2V1H0S0_9GAMM|nr:selenium-dependent molybdenum cofactor biosynthesis protein YqeB [Pelagibaculum spongiae]PVZ69612.1 EF2563 family selenium-dependent molybdenum hydroxylase system protein [Pelagibaculum spongiae]